MEPMGIVIFAVLMVASFVQVFIESVTRLVKHTKPATLPWSAAIVMAVTIVSKGIAWLACSRHRSSSVRALAQDAENDV